MQKNVYKKIQYKFLKIVCNFVQIWYN